MAAPAPEPEHESHSEDSSENDSGTDEREEIGRLRRRVQTEKARAKVQVNRSKRAAGQEEARGAYVGLVGEVQHSCFTPEFHRTFTARAVGLENHKRQNMFEMVAVVSYFHAMVRKLIELFQGGPNGVRVQHVIITVVSDDTNMNMANADGASQVCTCMNNVQHLMIRYKGAQQDGPGTHACLRFQLPAPMMILSRARATIMHAAMFAWCPMSAAGVGSKLAQGEYGPALASALKAVPLTGLVVLVDALKANSASFKLERVLARLRQKAWQPGDSIIAELFLKCGIHQLCLVRKPGSLAVPGVLACLVRLGHVMESATFKSRFLAALRHEVKLTFKWCRCPQLPPGAAKWRSCAYKLFDDCCADIGIVKCMEFQAVVNGDLDLDTVCHWCVNGKCCGTKAEAETNVVEAFEKLFKHFFQVPLLYRWKHIEPAKAWVFRCLKVCNMLVRVMNRLAGKSGTGQHQPILEEGVYMAGAQAPDSGNDPLESSFAELNAARFKLVHNTICRADVDITIMVFHLITRPIDVSINILLQRSTVLTKLDLAEDSEATPGPSSLATLSKTIFLDYVSGRFGKKLMSAFMNVLLTPMHQNLGIAEADVGPRMLHIIAASKLTLQNCILMLSDSWRRFCHNFSCFPYLTFQLVEHSASDEQFFGLGAEVYTRAGSLPSLCGCGVFNRDSDFAFSWLRVQTN